MRVKIVRLSNLGLHLQLEKAEREVEKQEARVNKLRLQKNKATEALHAARGHFQVLTARYKARR